MLVKYRVWQKGLPPRPIKLQIPGWAGDHHRHDDGATPQPWHCIPFVEGSTYGLELIYPFDAECHVTNENGQIKFQGDFSKECTWSDPPSPPFAAFAPTHFGYTSAVDIEVPDEYVVRLEPHPRFYTDVTGTCPCAVPGHIHPWWSRIFFVVFKSPLPGQTIIFRKSEPYAQILVVPKRVNYEIKEMSQEEAAERKQTESVIDHNRKDICNHAWTDHRGNQFDDKYKQLQSLFNKGGKAAIQKLVKKLQAKN